MVSQRRKSETSQTKGYALQIRGHASQTRGHALLCFVKRSGDFVDTGSHDCQMNRRLSRPVAVMLYFQVYFTVSMR